ncbi:hypothetical protein [Rivularia sp. UHCC 0363]|uniref:hypothetical protein n=1 Tax=Rivularia sp. UHCC 0363 TaxID=3110244 RepID=UPI002B2160AF|nr:hypothetical protein [Rivularia sp. UHCC 0363]MEA5595217.1 hypothetical protein [Rivularia sp. UHCC 0363]
MDCKIYFPTIHLFAYSRNPKFSDSQEDAVNINYDWLWKQCNYIIKTKLAYDFSLNFFLRNENAKVPAENLINQEIISENKQDSIHITKDIKYKFDDYFPLYIKAINNIQTEVYSRSIYDSYALCLKFYPTNQLKNKKFYFEEFEQQNLQFNPDNCLVLPQEDNKYFLGQTILITAKLTYKQRNQSLEWLKSNIADKYLEALFSGDRNFRKPVFNRAGKLFGRPIFEYGIYRQLDNYIHVLVWLIDNTDEKNIIEKIHKNLLGLFFFRAKVINAYQETRLYSKQVKIRNFKIEKRLEGMAVDLSYKSKLSDWNLTEIYHDLIELTQISVKYATIVRDIDEHQNTISNNTRNYIDKIREIKSIFPRESIGFLIFFGESTCRAFKDQIATDSSSYQHILENIDDLINATEGLLRIELHEIEKQHDTQEKKTDRNQNVLIFAAASGLGAAELASSNFNLIKQDNFIYNQPFINHEFINKNPYTSVIFYSFLFSLLVGTSIWFIWTILKFIPRILFVVKVMVFKIIDNRYRATK